MEAAQPACLEDQVSSSCGSQRTAGDAALSLGSQGTSDFAENLDRGSQGTSDCASNHGHNATMVAETAERASSEQRTKRTDAETKALLDGSKGTNRQDKRSPVCDPREGPPKALEPANLLSVELCCGSAGLTAALAKVGFAFMAVDHKHNKHKPSVPVIDLDLRSLHSWTFLERVYETRHVFFVHAGPPCGTASRAREIPLPTSGYTCQLRSATHPMGLPNLSPSDAEKVASANAIYENLAMFMIKLVTNGTYICIENPHRSYLWEIPAFQPLIQQCFRVTFDACMHGSDRDKRTTFLTNLSELRELAILCDKSHRHRPWGILPDGTFATASEAEYPALLCDSIAACVALAAGRHGYKIVPDEQGLMPHVASQKQPRVSKCPIVLEEFKFQVTIPLPSGKLPHLDSKNCLSCNLGPAPEKVPQREIVSITVGVYRSQAELRKLCSNITRLICAVHCPITSCA